jgi:hypothetical protein
MTFRGRVKNGVVVFEADVGLPEGAEVEVRPVDDVAPTWAEVFRDVLGKASDLPADAARNHDHYLYGAPRQ